MANGLRQWIREMNSVARARIALANLIYDLVEHRMPREVMKRFVLFIDSQWTKNSGRSPDKMIRIFARQDPLHHYCQGPNPKRPQQCAFSRILDAKTLWEKNIDLSHGGFALDDDVPDKEIARIEKHGLKGKAVGEMRTGEPFAWVTMTSELDTLRSSVDPADFPGHVRDRLGLIGYVQPEKLVEVRYPANVQIHLAAPTFIEGSPGHIFQSKKTADGWGRTVDLKTHEPALPEAVHHAVPFTDQFEVRRVGTPRHTMLVFDWDHFAESCVKSSSDIHVTKLMKMLTVRKATANAKKKSSAKTRVRAKAKP
jgi:hypothetical protein